MSTTAGCGNEHAEKGNARRARGGGARTWRGRGGRRSRPASGRAASGRRGGGGAEGGAGVARAEAGAEQKVERVTVVRAELCAQGALDGRVMEKKSGEVI